MCFIRYWSKAISSHCHETDLIQIWCRDMTSILFLKTLLRRNMIDLWTCFVLLRLSNKQPLSWNWSHTVLDREGRVHTRAWDGISCETRSDEEREKEKNSFAKTRSSLEHFQLVLSVVLLEVGWFSSSSSTSSLASIWEMNQLQPKKNQFQKISQRSLELALRDGSHEWNLDESILEWFEVFSKFINVKCVIEQRTILELIDINLLSFFNVSILLLTSL